MRSNLLGDSNGRVGEGGLPACRMEPFQPEVRALAPGQRRSPEPSPSGRISRQWRPLQWGKLLGNPVVPSGTGSGIKEEAMKSTGCSWAIYAPTPRVTSCINLIFARVRIFKSDLR